MIEVDDKVALDVTHGFHIPPKPEVLIKLKALMAHKEPEMLDIADLISSDVGLSAGILKAINSPLYGLDRSVSDIKQAVVFLGVTGTNALATAIELKRSFNQKDSCISLERFWDSATEIAAVSAFIAYKFKHKVIVESIYTLGLFHDCGIPAMACNYADYKELLMEANDNYEISQVELEQAKYSTDHATVGYFLAKSWHLPDDLCQVILRHQERDFLSQVRDEQMKMGYAAIKMAENIVTSCKRFVAAPDWPHIKQDVLDALEIDIDEYQDIRDDVDDIINSTQVVL
ncbi:HDOD domain-containing protein [Catenovulum adriaticum]|uniref:HDOD domain-containing protein n=1 Tax=Catenovulum adriaticum TaxID=2984846 RepID=A0ABY7AL54_9ALTE|nr:HDOD domain-containing protein [Catenovulum sp. TS8]WAJ69462.1 HDOD domain-containing protein [Catenovulum sp. TS8]